MALYNRIVAQARQPVFYSHLSVPDSLDGRFDMIVLHAILVMRRLGQIGEEGRKLSQALFDLLFADMDSSLREIGVGDLSVGKKVKAMGQAFYGRADAYEAALKAGTEEALTAALGRNLYGTQQPTPPAVSAMAAYMRQADAALAAQPPQELLAGNPTFPVPQA
ncbi:ubiquinol-cytochrome C chaperone family protein [uncultured Ferrovibrio sp.]|uniref:ubiquinol-cytochrome C chaperone family protein n=1 Tax=uncultured Ferrovibrio sp. TaxID=1576913 RepID=UPI002609B385|nr:ubiquinol-cytochrome C chaperone family protein [uncultured Ferrovibrio sp.]